MIRPHSYLRVIRYRSAELVLTPEWTQERDATCPMSCPGYSTAQQMQHNICNYWCRDAGCWFGSVGKDEVNIAPTPAGRDGRDGRAMAACIQLDRDCATARLSAGRRSRRGMPAGIHQAGRRA